MSVVLDTHTVLWYLENFKGLSAPARIAIEEAIVNGRQVHVSAISVVEAIYLAERNKIPRSALERLRLALRDASVGLSIAPVDAFIADALEKVSARTVPDMPDRIIAATALRFDVPLITRDRALQSAGIQTIW